MKNTNFETDFNRNEEQQYIFYFELGKSYIEGVVCGGLRYYE